MARKRKINDDCNSAKPKRSREVLPLCDKMKIIDLVVKDKKSYAEVGRMFNKNESSIREIVKKEKEIRASVTCAPKTAKVTSIVRDKCLVKTEKALHLWLEDMSRKCVPVDNNLLRQKALILYEEFSKGSTEKRSTKPFSASKGWLVRFRNRYELIKITGKAASANEEEDDGEVKKIIQVARELGEVGFVDMIDEVKKHIEGHKAILTYEELQELINSSADEDDEENYEEEKKEKEKKEKEEEKEEEGEKGEEEEPSTWTLHKFNEVFQMAQNLKDKIMEYDPWVERSIKVTRMITEGLQPLQEQFDELKSKGKQLPITMFFKTVSAQEKDKE